LLHVRRTDAPLGDSCIGVSGVATVPHLGEVTYNRIVLVNNALFDPALSGLSPPHRVAD
jgi:hypothetical protein